MDDYGHIWTDEELAELEKRIAALYRTASEDMQDEIDAYFDRLEDRDERQRQFVKEGRITEEHYKQWRLNQIGRGERMEALRDALAERMTRANETAVSYVNDATPGIYSMNRNYAAYTIEQAAGNVGFTLWDEQTVRRLAVEQPDLMPFYPPKKAVQRGIDLAWGKRQITAQMTSGILQGESIKKLADRLQTNIPKMNRDSAIRTARTAVTGAQNAGRQESFTAAAKMGIKVQKRWVAIKDSRTRHDHGAADGQTVPLNDPFIVGGERLMFPGDRAGSGWNIYNCRCSMRTVEKEGIEAEPRMMRVRDPETGRNVLINEMTYQEWYEWKRNQDPVAFEAAKKKAKNASSDKQQFEEYKAVLKSKAGKTFDEFQKMKYNDTERWEFMKLDYARRSKLLNHPEMALPNADKATAAKEKFTGYLFNPENKNGWAKGQVITSRLGYSAENWKSLQNEILRGSRVYPANHKGNSGYGEKYEQRMVLYGKNGTPANVVVGWIQNEDGSVSMTSAYIKEVK